MRVALLAGGSSVLCEIIFSSPDCSRREIPHLSGKGFTWMERMDPKLMKRNTTLPIVAAGFLLITSGGVRANLIPDGSFESPVTAPGLSSVRPAGWTGYGSFVGGLVHGPGVMQGSFQYPDPFDGDQFVDIGVGEIVTSFTVATPGDYILKWYDNSLITGGNGSYGVEIRDGTLATVISTAYSYSYLTPSPPWRELTLDLPALAAGSYTLKFGPGTTHTYLDNVSLEARQAVAAPDGGSTASLLGLALGAVIGLASKMSSAPEKHHDLPPHGHGR